MEAGWPQFIHLAPPSGGYNKQRKLWSPPHHMRKFGVLNVNFNICLMSEVMHIIAREHTSNCAANKNNALLWVLNQRGSAGSEIHPCHSYFLPFFPNTDASDHNCLSISNGPGAMSQTWVLSQRKALSNVLRRKLDFLSAPAILRQEFIRVFPVCDPLLLPHLSLAANTQLLGYLSRAPIKGCHSGLQCPWANHIRAPAHAQPLLCCSSPAMLITFKYFHRWPISCLRGEQQHESKLMFEEPKLTSIYVNTNKRQNHWIRKLSQC